MRFVIRDLVYAYYKKSETDKKPFGFVAVILFLCARRRRNLCDERSEKRAEHCDGAENSPRGAENALLNYTKYNFL